MQEYEQTHNIDSLLFDNKNANNENSTRPTGFIGFPQQPMAPIQAPPINYPVSIKHKICKSFISYLFYIF
jgi:hypothetical protein